MRHSVSYHPPGDRVAAIWPGDLILVHGFSFAPRMIRFGQRLQFRGERARYSFWNHAAVYVGDGTLIEAKGRFPVREVPLAQYDVRYYAVVHIDTPSLIACTSPGFRFRDADEVMRLNAVRFCHAKEGSGYGYLTLLGLGWWALTGGRVTLGLGSSFICSGLAAEATERLGVVYDRDPSSMTPAHLAEHFDVALA